MESLQTLQKSLRRHLSRMEMRFQPDELLSYTKDEALKGESSIAVIFPKTALEVSQVVRWASENKIAIVPRGAGSGLSGAATPISRSSIVLSLEKMNRILEIDVDNFFITVEPGVITGDLRKEVEAKGLFYPPIPASVDFCTIGGNVATNAGGLCAVKYGVTRKYVTGLEIVLADGSIIQTGGKLQKISTGYDLTQLLVGSEGTLGIITKITLQLLPKPQSPITLLTSFSSLKDVCEAVVDIIRSGIQPPTLELLPREAIELVLAKHEALTFPFQDKAATLLIELDNIQIEAQDSILDRLAGILSKNDGSEPILAATASQRNELWTVRKHVRESIATSGDFIEADSVVPRTKIPDLMMASQRIGAHYGLRAISYGHAGDGNLHTYFMRGKEDDQKWKTQSTSALREFFEETIKLGGTLSGEHGIGFLKKDYMPIALTEQNLTLQKRIKQAFDPEGILNPSKVFPS